LLLGKFDVLNFTKLEFIWYFKAGNYVVFGIIKKSFESIQLSKLLILSKIPDNQVVRGGYLNKREASRWDDVEHLI
jgi:hypothetical protein